MKREMKLSPAADRCLALAKEEAAKKGYSQVNSGCLLYSFLQDMASRAFIILDSIGVPKYDVKQELERLCPKIGQRVDAPGQTEELKRVMERAAKIAENEEAEEVGGHHILSAMASDENSIGFKILLNLEIDPALVVKESTTGRPIR